MVKLKYNTYKMKNNIKGMSLMGKGKELKVGKVIYVNVIGEYSELPILLQEYTVKEVLPKHFIATSGDTGNAITFKKSTFSYDTGIGFIYKGYRDKLEFANESKSQKHKKRNRLKDILMGKWYY